MPCCKQLNQSVALLQDELHDVKPSTPLLDRNVQDIEDLIFPSGIDTDAELAQRDSFSPFSLNSFLDESMEWNEIQALANTSDAATELFHGLDREFKQLTLNGNGRLTETPVSNTDTDAVESPQARRPNSATTPTPTPTSSHRTVRRVVRACRRQLMLDCRHLTFARSLFRTLAC